jgi:predicted TIM-barrel fold metal-dependent hydrolase
MAGGAALAALAPEARAFGLRGVEAGRPVTGRPVIDTHMHVWSDQPDRFPFAHPFSPGLKPPACKATVEVLLEDMDANGVTHCVLVQMINCGWDNRYVASCVKLHPGRLKAHGLIDPTDLGVAQKLEYWVKEQGLSGMRFSPMYYQGKDDWLNAGSSEALWRKAAELGAVFNFFISTPQLPKLEDMVRRFPGVPVVIDHLAQVDLKVEDPLPELKKLLVLSRYPFVWVKVSELTSVSKSGKYPFRDAYPWVRRVYDAFGPDRLLWGTGYPAPARAHFQRPTLEQELALIREHIPFFSAEDRDKILGVNAARLWRFAGSQSG